MEEKHGENISHPIPMGSFGYRFRLRKCFVGEETAYFHGVFQFADTVPPSPMVGGDPGGQIAYPVAVVEKQDGTFAAVRLGDIHFPEELKVNVNFNTPPAEILKKILESGSRL